jgi:hypothetical protein
MDLMDAIDARIAIFRNQHPGAPVTWEALASAGLIRGVPVDPSGTPFVVDPSSGKTIVSPQSKLFPLPGQNPGERP